MTYCEKCAKLVGKSSPLLPHDELTRLHGVSAEGAHEHYRCDGCGSILLFDRTGRDGAGEWHLLT